MLIKKCQLFKKSINNDSKKGRKKETRKKERRKEKRKEKRPFHYKKDQLIVHVEVLLHKCNTLREERGSEKG